MYVCNCAGITTRQIQAAVIDGALTVKQLKQQLGVASGCGKCACDAREVIFDTLAEQTLPPAASQTIEVRRSSRLAVN